MTALGSWGRLLEKRFYFLSTTHAIGPPQAYQFLGIAGLEQQIRNQCTAVAHSGSGSRRYTKDAEKGTSSARHLIQMRQRHLVQGAAGSHDKSAYRAQRLAF